LASVEKAADILQTGQPQLRIRNIEKACRGKINSLQKNRISSAGYPA